MTPHWFDKLEKTLKMPNEESAKEVPPKNVTSLGPKEIRETFGITYNKEPLRLHDKDINPFPQSLEDLLDDYELAMNDAPEDEAYQRLAAMAGRLRSRDSMVTLTEYRSVKFQQETRINSPCYVDKNKVLLTGNADYTLWYGDGNAQESTW